MIIIQTLVRKHIKSILRSLVLEENRIFIRVFTGKIHLHIGEPIK